MDFRRGDIAYEIADICRRAAAFCYERAGITVEGVSEGIESIYDATAIKRMMLNLILYSVTKSRAAYPQVLVKIEKKDDSLAITLISKGSGIGDAGRELREALIEEQEMELNIVTIFARKHKGSFISTNRQDGGLTIRVSIPLIIESPDENLSSLMVDWYGGMDIVAVEMSGFMPPEAYEADSAPQS